MVLEQADFLETLKTGLKWAKIAFFAKRRIFSQKYLGPNFRVKLAKILYLCMIIAAKRIWQQISLSAILSETIKESNIQKFTCWKKIALLR